MIRRVVLGKNKTTLQVGPLWFLSLAALSFAGGEAQEIPLSGTAHVQTAKVKAPAPPPYCGIHCVFGAMQALGGHVEFEQLLQPRYLRSQKGSSGPELIRAATDHGFYAVGLSGLSDAALANAQHPMILHTAGYGQLKEYNHWILFLGMEGKQARIADAPNDVRLMPVSNLMAIWDSTAIVVSGEEIPTGMVLAPDRLQLLQHIILVVLVAAFLRITVGPSEKLQPWQRFRSVARESSCLLFISTLVAVVTQCDDVTGLLRHPAARKAVAAGNLDSFLQKLTYLETKQYLATGTQLVVDARYTRDYDRGHIPGALSVPVNTTDTERHTTLRDVSKDTPIIVYCQSVGCRFDETVAVALARDGFRDVKLFHGGWVEWENNE